MLRIISRHMRIIKPKYIAIAAVTIGVIGYLLTIAIAGISLTPWWWIVPGALGAALLTGLSMWPAWRQLTGRAGFTPNFLTHIAAATGIALAAVYGLNFIASPTRQPERVVCTVDRLYRTEHHHTRRLRKGRYIADGPIYYRYHAHVTLPDGQQCRVDINDKRYRRLKRHRSDTIHVTLRPGLLGIRTIHP